MKTCIRWVKNKAPFNGSGADRKGVLLASLCLVHCVAGPVLLSFAGFASLINVSEKFEPLFLLGSAAMGGIALVPAYRKKHGRIACLAMFGSGLLCLLLRRRFALGTIAIEPVAAAIGASLIIGAHLLNLRFSTRCSCCDPLSETIREGTHGGRQSTLAPQVQTQPDSVYTDSPTIPIPERKI